MQGPPLFGEFGSKFPYGIVGSGIYAFFEVGMRDQIEFKRKSIDISWHQHQSINQSINVFAAVVGPWLGIKKLYCTFIIYYYFNEYIYYILKLNYKTLVYTYYL